MTTKKILTGLVLFGLLGLAYGYYSYNKGARDLSSERADIALDANALLLAFQEDEQAANGNYLDKVILVEGVVADISADELTSVTLETEDIMSAIVCEMAPDQEPAIKEGDRVEIKGQCTGFLSDVILVKCVLSK